MRSNRTRKGIAKHHADDGPDYSARIVAQKNQKAMIPAGQQVYDAGRYHPANSIREDKEAGEKPRGGSQLFQGRTNARKIETYQSSKNATDSEPGVFKSGRKALHTGFGGRIGQRVQKVGVKQSVRHQYSRAKWW